MSIFMYSTCMQTLHWTMELWFHRVYMYINLVYKAKLFFQVYASSYSHILRFSLRLASWGFHGGSVVKNPPAQCRIVRFNAWSGKIPHTAEQRSLCVTTVHMCIGAWEPQLLSPRATAAEAGAPYSLCSTREATAMRSCVLQLENSPHSLQPEKSPHSSEDPEQPKLDRQINKNK